MTHVNPYQTEWYIDLKTIASRIRTYILDQIETPTNVPVPPFGPTLYRTHCRCGSNPCRGGCRPCVPTCGDTFYPGFTWLGVNQNQFPYPTQQITHWAGSPGDSPYFQSITGSMIDALRSFLPEHVFDVTSDPDLGVNFHFTSTLFDNDGMFLVHQDDLMEIKSKIEVVMPYRKVNGERVPTRWTTLEQFQTDEPAMAEVFEEILTVPTGFMLTARMERFGVAERVIVSRTNRIMYSPTVG